MRSLFAAFLGLPHHLLPEERRERNMGGGEAPRWKESPLPPVHTLERMRKGRGPLHDILPYDRGAAVRYAHRWAYDRNPAYYDFSELGGDCTNFASQCLYAGSGVMDHTPTFGWYYISGNQKSPSWSGVPYFYNFLTRKDSRPGPFGTEAGLGKLEPGDFIQLSFAGGVFAHNPIVVEIRQPAFPDTILVAAHSQDADFRPLSTYPYQALRGIHILGVRPR